MKIPWAKPYIGEREFKEVKKCFERKWLSIGKKVEEFEGVASNLVWSKYAVAVNSGTAALDIALKLIEIKPGDEVIIPALAYIATGNAVLYQQSIPVFADIDTRTYTISPESVRKKITDKTKAVIAIDYAGQSADYDALRDILTKRKIFLIEDAAPAFGGKYKNKSLCTMGDISITSFHMAKIFTSVEGGMLFFEKEKWFKLARMMRSQGEDPLAKYHHPVLGHNYRMTDLHASIGIEQIKRFVSVLKKRVMIANRYSESLSGIKNVVIPKVLKGNKHAWFLYPILVTDRKRVISKLKEKGIETNVSWPMPIYKQKIYRKYFKEVCPVAEQITQSVLCLPMYYEMTKIEQNYVINSLIEILR